MAQNGAAFMNNEKYGTTYDATKKHLIKGALICGEGRQAKHLNILWMSVLHRSEQGICVPNANC